MDFMLSEECVWPVTDHARVAETSQLNASNALMDFLIQTGDASEHVDKEHFWMWFQGHAAHAIHRAKHAALKETVSPVQMKR
jgi:hypothetical protein